MMIALLMQALAALTFAALAGWQVSNARYGLAVFYALVFFLFAGWSCATLHANGKVKQ